jgi:TM2 domain-containing membrane protein YozV
MMVNYMANKYLATILSFFIPGVGQAYAGNIKKGIAYFLVAFVALGIIGTFFVDSVLDSFYYIIDILISIYAAYDAYLMAKD